MFFRTKTIRGTAVLQLVESYRLEMAGDQREWRTLRRLLGTHVVATTRLPLEDGREVSIRKPSQPDAEQERVYALLGIDWKRAYSPRKTEMKR